MCKQTRVCVWGIGGVRSEKEWPIGGSLWRKTSPVTPTPNKTHNSLTSQQSKESHNSSVSFKSHGFLFHIFIQLTPQSNGFYRPLTLIPVYLWFLHLLNSAFLYNPLVSPCFPCTPTFNLPLLPDIIPSSPQLDLQENSQRFWQFLFSQIHASLRSLCALRKAVRLEARPCPPYRQLLGHPSYRCPPRSCFLFL